MWYQSYDLWSLFVYFIFFQPDNFYAKQIEGDLPYAYIKSTINSTHKNMFEVNADRKAQENLKVNIAILRLDHYLSVLTYHAYIYLEFCSVCFTITGLHFVFGGVIPYICDKTTLKIMSSFSNLLVFALCWPNQWNLLASICSCSLVITRCISLDDCFCILITVHSP